MPGNESADEAVDTVGAAFPHKDGKGFNVILQAHPIGEKIVVRLYEPDIILCRATNYFLGRHDQIQCRD